MSPVGSDFTQSFMTPMFHHDTYAMCLSFSYLLTGAEPDILVEVVYDEYPIPRQLEILWQPKDVWSNHSLTLDVNVEHFRVS